VGAVRVSTWVVLASVDCDCVCIEGGCMDVDCVVPINTPSPTSAPAPASASASASALVWGGLA
jgi:hypothetical protein